MNIYVYPNDNNYVRFGSSKEVKNLQGQVGRFLKKLSKKHPDLWVFTDTSLKGVRKLDNLGDMEKKGLVGSLKGVNFPLYEFRFPPTRRGGVVRIYFTKCIDDMNAIILLTAELKKGKKANNEVIKQAEKNYKELLNEREE